MAKKVPLKLRVTPEAAEEVLREIILPLVSAERAALKAFFQTPAFKRAWQLAKRKKPSAMTSDLNGINGQLIGNNRLHEIRGWEMFEAALLTSADEPVARVQPKEESYPESGNVIGSIPRTL